MKQSAALFLVLGVCGLLSCSTTPVSKKIASGPKPDQNSSATIRETEGVKTLAAAAPPAIQQEMIIYSPYSTDGLLALNEFRSNNSALNDFLNRNRKPDYFFSGINTDYSYQKVYLVFLASENLYLFDAKLKEPYKKFHPLPDSVKENFKNLMPKKSSAPVNIQPSTVVQQTDQAQTAVNEIDNSITIEKNLPIKAPQPYLNPELLYAIPRQGMSGSENPLYPELYFLDKPLNDLLENQYSAKYDSNKHTLKVIFPKSYEAEILYKKPDTETRKIFIERNVNGSSELSLMVPDFLPGSAFYKTTHGNISKAFSSLYQINVPQSFVDTNQLHIRYSIKLCQKDTLDYCAAKKGNSTYVRAIVIEATLYDYTTKMPIETFVLK